MFYLIDEITIIKNIFIHITDYINACFTLINNQLTNIDLIYVKETKKTNWYYEI